MLFILPVEQWRHHWYIQMKEEWIVCHLSIDAFQWDGDTNWSVNW